MIRIITIAVFLVLGQRLLSAQQIDNGLKFQSVEDYKTLKEFFVMEPGGCLRGPLKFFDKEGKELFSLKR